MAKTETKTARYAKALLPYCSANKLLCLVALLL